MSKASDKVLREAKIANTRAFHVISSLQEMLYYENGRPSQDAIDSFGPDADFKVVEECLAKSQSRLREKQPLVHVFSEKVLNKGDPVFVSEISTDGLISITLFESNIAPQAYTRGLAALYLEQVCGLTRSLFLRSGEMALSSERISSSFRLFNWTPILRKLKHKGDTVYSKMAYYIFVWKADPSYRIRALAQLRKSIGTPSDDSVQ